MTLQWLLNYIYVHFQSISILATIGAYGLAIIVLTIMIRLLLAPLQQFQLVRQRRSMVEQRKLAPQVAELRKKFKNDRAKLNAETMKLYQEHGVNPLGGLVGCLPLVVQMPVLIALYYVFTGFAHSAHTASHFLFIPNLNDNPSHHLLIAGLPIPTFVYLIFPLLAAATTLVQSKMLQMPPSPNPTEQEQQTQQMQRTMVWLSPVMIGVFALNVPAGLGLYWFVGNLVSIIQQSFVVGWGNVIPARFKNGASSPPPDRSQGGRPKAGPSNPQKPGGPSNGPKSNGPSSGPRQKKPRK
ncbi:MAG: YidC/Oxa1 family membrane protein insertase [Candidatus Dormibacterales bacterium]